MTWRWNRDYKDTEQVAPFLAAFNVVHDEITGAGAYPYNASFKGRVAGIEGPDEETAIYLLQTLRALRELDAKVAAYLADGGEPVTSVREVTKFASVVHYGFYMGGTGWSTWADARLLEHNGSMVVLPKGKRTNGYLLQGKILVKRYDLTAKGA